jgi:hypothetical protein
VLRGDLAEEVRTLKHQLGGEIGVTGSITLIHSLIAAVWLMNIACSSIP